MDKYELEKTPPITKDFLGNEIKVGDKVVYMRLGYRDFTKGYIMRITNKCVFLSDSNGSLIHDYWTSKFHEQVVKVC